jgi:hypothetical protein
MRVFYSLLAGAALTSLSLSAFAQSKSAENQEAPRASTSYGYLSPGLSLSTASDRVWHSVGVGGELSYLYYPSEHALGWGAFGQAELYQAGETRAAAGLMLGKVLGAELGYAYRGAHAALPGAPSLHLGGYLSLKFVALSLRFSPALTRSAASTMGTETELAATFKLPVLLHGKRAPSPGSGYPMWHWMGGG